jgi:hypothetical protein
MLTCQWHADMLAAPVSVAMKGASATYENLTRDPGTKPTRDPGTNLTRDPGTKPTRDPVTKPTRELGQQC